MRVLGYVRVSKSDGTQELDRQFRDLEFFALRFPARLETNLFIFSDKCSGRKDPMKRPGFLHLLDFAQDGDTIIAHEVSRIGRSTLDGLNLVKKLKDRNINILTMDGCDSTDEFNLTIHFAMATQESKKISDRTKSGLALAKEKGVKLGGREKKEEVAKVKFYINRHNYSVKDACAKVKISLPTYYKHR